MPEPAPGVMDFVIDPERGSFSIHLTEVQTSVGPIEGLLTFYGSNPRYYGADLLLIDFSVSQYSYEGLLFHQPGTVTLTHIFPDTVAIYDPPADGPTWPFEFEHHDDYWRPGWTSEQLPVGFYVPRGQTVRVQAEVRVAPADHVSPTTPVSRAVTIAARADVTDLVNDWLEGRLPNHGVLIRDTKADGVHRTVQFTSRDALMWYEGQTGARGPGPRLVLVYQ